jgi:hypothetical protein
MLRRATMSSISPPHESQERAAAVVLVGRFNPSIFQPAWFEAKDLVAPVDAESKNMILMDGYVSYETPQFQLVCTEDRCQFGTTAKTATADVLRDIVVGTFALLPETPLWEFGVNHAAHIPKDVRSWDELAAQLGDPHRTFVLLPNQRLSTVEFGADRDDGRQGRRTILLQPSILLDGGVYVGFNDHITVVPESERAGNIGARDTITEFQSAWAGAVDSANSVIAQLAPR